MKCSEDQTPMATAHGSHRPPPRPPQVPVHLLLALVLSSLLGLRPCAIFRGAAATDQTGRSTVPFEVGVILDTNTWVGNISWSCMSLAADDFYAQNPNYATRLSFHLRDTDYRDVYAAAAEAVDLIKNSKVEAIIGPQSSAQAEFLAGLGNKTQVPIISFSAKGLPVSFAQTPFFIRAAWSDLSQTEVVASLVEAFGWREVVPVYEDTDYSNVIAPCLMDAVQGVGARVPYRSAIPSTAGEDQIIEELKQLKKRRARVFVVHMSYDLALQLFSHAKEAGMMKDGYIWITIYSLTDVVSLWGAPAIDLMQGFLGLKPYVPETDKLRDLKVRWRRRYLGENPAAKVTEPTMFGLWAYDTVWSLAMAAERLGTKNTSSIESDANNSSGLLGLGSSARGPALRNLLLSTNFSGVSGQFDLASGQLEPKSYEITNVGRQGNGRVAVWTSPGMNLTAALETNITWPGGSRLTVPKGWEWPTSGNTLKIAVPVKPGFSQFINIVKDPVTNKSIPRGYCIDVFDAVMKRLRYSVPYEYIPYEDNSGEMNGTYDDLVYQVYLQKFDAVVGDVTIIANRSLYVDFTLPYIESGVSMIVPVKDKSPTNAWTFLEPLTATLWFVSGLFVVFTGAVVWFLEHRINDDFRGSALNQAGTTFHFAFSTLVFAHRERILGNLARVVVVVWVFVVLILQQSYTASLSSKLTVQQLQPTVTDLDQLLKNGDFVGYLTDSFLPGLLKRLKFNESKLIAYSSPDEYNEALSNGTVAAIFDEIPYIKVFLSKFCNKYTRVGPTYKTGGFGFVFPKGSPLVPDISKAILEVAESKEMIDIENKLYGNKSCSDKGGLSSASSSLTFNSFWGLFLISGVTSLSALLVHILLFIYEHRDARRYNSDGSLYRWLVTLVTLYTQTRSGADGASEKAEADDLPDGVEMFYFPDVQEYPVINSNDVDGVLEPPDDETISSTSESGGEISGRLQSPPSFAWMIDAI